MNTFPQRLRELRREKSLTQADLAKMLNYTQSNVSEWEKGTVDPRSTALSAIASFFNVSIDYLLGRTDELGGATVPSPTAPPLTRSEQRLLSNFRAMRSDLQEYYLNMSETFLQTPESISRSAQKKDIK